MMVVLDTRKAKEVGDIDFAPWNTCLGLPREDSHGLTSHGISRVDNASSNLTTTSKNPAKFLFRFLGT